MRSPLTVLTTSLLALLYFCCINVANSYANESDNDKVYGFLLDLSFEELTNVPIQSSGLFPLSQDKTPGTLYVVPEEQFKKYNIRSIAEYLNMQVPGISTAIHGTQGTTVGVRGILIDNTSKTLFLRDNININNRKFVGINGSELSSPLLGDIDRIEIALGPGAVRHGSGAINGSINVISATGNSKKGLRLNSEYGSGDSRLVEGSYGHVFSERANLFFYGGYDKSDGVRPHYTLPANQWAGLNGVSGTPSETFLDNVRVGKTDDDYKFSLRAQLGTETDFFSMDVKGLFSHTSNVDPVLGEYLANTANWSDEVQLAADARGGRYSPFFEQHSDNVLFSPEITLRFNGHNTLDIIPYYHRIETTSVFSDFLLEQISALNITPTAIGPLPDCQALGCLEKYTYGDELHLGTTLIQNYSGIQNQNIAWGGEIKYFEFKAHRWHWTTMSAFAEDQLTSGKFTILGGVRYDKTFFGSTMETIPPFIEGPYEVPEDVDKITCRLALSYQINKDQTAKLSYQEGFRFADAWLHQWNAHLNTANSTHNEIYPEESESYEANYSVRNLWDNSLNLQGSFYYNIYHDTQGYLPNVATFGNAAATLTSMGTEISADYSPNSAFEGKLSYSYAHPIDSYENAIKIANADDSWTRYPVHMLKLLMGYKITPNLFIGGNALIESPRYEKAQVTDPTIENLFDQWTFRMNANAWYNINQHIKISFTAKELFHKNFNQMPAYFNGTRPLDSPRAADPQFYLSASFSY